MEQVIYGDVYFAVNLTMDWLALFLTARARKLPLRPLRTTLAAALGGGYALAALFLPDGNPLSAFTALAIPALLLLLAFGWQGRAEMLRTLAVFWTVSFLLGGALTAVSYLFARLVRREILLGGQVETLPAPLPFWGILLLALLIAFAVSLLLRARQKRPATVQVEIGDADGALSPLTGLVDSGNLLAEPLSGLPVILVDRESADFLPAELRFLREGSAPTPTARLRLIPYSTAAGEGILYGYLPRVVKIGGKLRSACVAVAPLPDDPSRDAQAILPASLL